MIPIVLLLKILLTTGAIIGVQAFLFVFFLKHWAALNFL